jgi:hypothetical protein
MADIFISYSKSDRDKVVMLAAYLESEGWMVWWDTNLAVGDAYRDEIMKQLAAARAVIVLWTQTSIKSDFVRAEAGRAKANGKLIPVKESDVGYGDIPLPFGEMHTEDLSKRELIRAAVVAQLEKPQTQPNFLWVASKTLRYGALTWLGIAGGAITLFTNLRGLLDFSEFARFLVTHWQQWTYAFWQFAANWLGLSVTPTWTTLLSLASFSIMTAFGATGYQSYAGYPRLPYVKAAWHLCLGLVLAVGLSTVPRLEAYQHQIFIALLSGFIILMALEREKHAREVASFAAFYAFVFFILFATSESSRLARYVPVLGSWWDEIWEYKWILAEALVFQAIYMTLPMVMVAIAPPRALTKRLMFLCSGFLLLVVLNHVAVYASSIRSLFKLPV